MTRLPSVATITRDLADCREDAIAIRKIMERFSHQPENMLEKVNAFLGCCGVEYIYPAEENTGIHYVNMGDSYIPTLCYDEGSGRIFISSWGDIVERNPRRFR